MGSDEQHRPDTEYHRWVPRPRPGPGRLLTDELVRRASLPLRTLTGARKALSRPGRAIEDASHAASSLVETIGASLSPAADTPFNVEIGPNRRFDWTRFDLGVVREVKQKLGGTVNDVVLACVSGAVRDYLEHHEVDLKEIDFRTFVPVSTRTDEQHGKLGNRVSLLVAQLPVDEADPRKRMARVVEETKHLKKSGQAQATELIEEVSDWTATALLTQFSRLAASRRSYNLVVTNVPGPPGPVYLSGARMLASYPLVPLFSNQALGIAVFTFDGGMFWGFNSDWDAIPDLHDFVLAMDREFETLRKL